MATDKKAPAGMIRVIGVDLFSHEDYLVGDYRERGVAFGLADAHNKARASDMDDVYYVYDDRGSYLRGNESVGQIVSP